ncbi:hypothetical protein [Rathayibacter sp. VKM Ac-2927]|uniref:hypothetical protein n=1 Tax=Rathayibacter sp. VKM Ac-2927 TaxID=2929478 RepID=UPI001FB4FD3C|nr:hypothetical protein [Rathayibacter sp. VKM Ac-2927]MCJ1687045.1 hypothetical protein [Rathayibacter sp. VKM Ac-2927]
MSACLLGSTALIAHADEAAVPVVSETPAQAVVVDPTAQAVASAPAALEAAPAPAAQTSAPTVAPEPVSPAPVSPAASAAPAATASGEATVHATAAPATPVPTAPAAEAPIVPAPALQDAPADAPAAATETPVSAPQQQPTPAASASMSDGVTATVKGVLDLKPGEKPTVGTTVKWTITLHNITSHPVDVLKAFSHLEPGESGDVEDNLAPTTLTQTDLDAGRVTYASRYDVVSSNGRQIIRARGALELASTTTPTATTTPTNPATPTAPTTPTAPASQAPDATAHAAQSSSIRGELLLEPDEKVTADTRVKWTVTITNTGEVPLHDVDNGHTGERVDLAVGQSKDLTATLPLGQSALANGTATLTARTSGISDTGVLVHSRATGTLTLPTTTTTPTIPATPTVPTTPTAPTAQAPDATAHAAQTSSDRTAH